MSRFERVFLGKGRLQRRVEMDRLISAHQNLLHEGKEIPVPNKELIFRMPPVPSYRGKSVMLFAAMCLFFSGVWFGAGADVSTGVDPEFYDAVTPRCPIEYSVWGTARKSFHTKDSPYRRSVVPQRCFSTEDDAISAGYVKKG